VELQVVEQRIQPEELALTAAVETEVQVVRALVPAAEQEEPVIQEPVLLMVVVALAVAIAPAGRVQVVVL
jgi:hypothetical protein